MLHAEIRKRDLIDMLFALRLCVSYDRLLQVSATFSNLITDHFDVDKGVSPPASQHGLFTTAAVETHVLHQDQCKPWNSKCISSTCCSTEGCSVEQLFH
jgi:hypothetical protein